MPGSAWTEDERLRRAFLEEGDELVQKLGESLSALEADPGSHDLVHEVFRLTHSLKSESALMGHASLSGLAHAMEDVLESVRGGELALAADVLEKLVAGADRLALMMGEISRGERDADSDPSDVVQDLRALIGSRRGTGDEATDGPPARGNGAGPHGGAAEGVAPAEPVFGAQEVSRLAEARERGESLFRVTVTVATDEPMKFARAFLVFNNFEQSANVIRAIPAMDGEPADDASYARTVFYLTSAPDDETLRAAARVDQIAMVETARLEFPSAGSIGRPLQEHYRADAGPIASDRGRGPGPAGPPVEKTTIRVDARRLDDLWRFVAELVLHKSHVSRLSDGVARGMDADSIREELMVSSDSLEKISSGMQQAMRDTRSIPISIIFSKFPRLVRDLSRKLGKPVDLVMSGQETEIDRSIVEALSDPLTHIIRNALDHGLEFPEERVRLGKPERGRIAVSARRQGGTIVIELADDGRGLDTERIRQKAIDLGIPDAASLGEADLRELVFRPGFSTKEVVTDLSGRGVGMDVVATRIRNDLRGTVELASETGKGTRVVLRLPFTLTIVNSLLVEDGGHLYAIPLGDLDSTSKVSAGDIVLQEQGEAGPWMEELIPLYSIGGLLGGERTPREEYFAVVLRHGASRGLLVVEELIEEREMVIRPIDDLLNTRRLFSGVSVLDDGRLVFILDTSFIRRDNF
ncbi:MAG TPA: chemotaxis protein CheA [Spirochaetia bacterium]|nr:chemotaxis protein CheA [Spirochaetia bacterium]